MSLRRSARIAGLEAPPMAIEERKRRNTRKNTGDPTRKKPLPLFSRPHIATLDEFLAIRREKLERVKMRPLYPLLRKLKQDAEKNRAAKQFYCTLMHWLFAIGRSTFSREIHIEIWPDEVQYIPGLLRVIKAIDPSIRPRIIECQDLTPFSTEPNRYVKFLLDLESPSFDDSVLDSDHLFPEWPLCSPGFNVLEGDW